MSEDQYNNPEEVRDFINRLSEKSGPELSAIITRYISYRSEAVEAALYVSVEKGLISYDLKELLWNQITAMFKAHESKIKYNRWESSNAFVQYFSAYNDDEIYEIIDDPNNIVIDVYHALLITARNRELISEVDFRRYYDEAKQSVISDVNLNRSFLADVFSQQENPDDAQIQQDIESEREKYWKCPNCNENVGMEYAICWNCQTPFPEEIVHPNPNEIRRELQSKLPSSPVRTGIALTGAGILIFGLDLLRHYKYSSYFATHLGGYIISGLIVLSGLGFIIYGAFIEKSDE